MDYFQDSPIDQSQQCDWCEDQCGMGGSIFFQGDKCQRQQQPWGNALQAIEWIEIVIDRLAVFWAEFAYIRRDYDL